MKTDYFLKKYIITTYTDNNNITYQIDVFKRENKTTYQITNQDTINKILQAQCIIDNMINEIDAQ